MSRALNLRTRPTFSCAILKQGFFTFRNDIFYASTGATISINFLIYRYHWHFQLSLFGLRYHLPGGLTMRHVQRQSRVPSLASIELLKKRLCKSQPLSTTAEFSTLAELNHNSTHCHYIRDVVGSFSTQDNFLSNHMAPKFFFRNMNG